MGRYMEGNEETSSCTNTDLLFALSLCANTSSIKLSIVYTIPFCYIVSHIVAGKYISRYMESNEETNSYEDYYKVLEVDYDATDERIKLNYRKLALKWHPDKHKDDNAVTARFQQINEAYTVLSDPVKRLDYDITGNYEIDKYTLREYLTRFKGMILTCNGLGMSHSSVWPQQLMESNECSNK